MPAKSLPVALVQIENALISSLPGGPGHWFCFPFSGRCCHALEAEHQGL